MGNFLAHVKPKSRSLFHYTTAEGLVGIIKNKCLFATHSEFSNDSTECKNIIPIIADIIEQEYRKIVPALVERGAFDKKLFEDHGTSFYRREAENSATLLLKAANKVAPYFITSFCLHGPESDEYKNGLLSQWRGYARGGFAIEFDELEVDKLNNDEQGRWRYQGFITEKVWYSDHNRHPMIEKFAGFGSALMRHLLEADAEKYEDILGQKTVDDFGRPFLSTAPFLKHVGFREETEYRIVGICNRPSRRDPKDSREPKEIRYRFRSDGSLIPYIALYDGLKSALPIKAIIVGPHPQQGNQANAVEILLEQYGIDADIRVSNIAFRP